MRIGVALVALSLSGPANAEDYSVWKPAQPPPAYGAMPSAAPLTSEELDGKRVYSITDAGRAHLEERQASGSGAAPWEMGTEGRERFGKLFGAMSQLGAAVMQVARAGTGDQLDRVTEIVGEARKKVYALLAED